MTTFVSFSDLGGACICKNEHILEQPLVFQCHYIVLSELRGIMLSFYSEGSSVHTCANYLVWLVSPSPCPVSGTLEPFMGIIKQNPCLL